jgi:hypothetical protein
MSLWYTNVLKSVYPAVKSVRPDVKVRSRTTPGPLIDAHHLTRVCCGCALHPFL